MSAEQRLVQLGIALPAAPKVMGLYRPVLQSGKYLYVSGHGPLQEDGTMAKGRLGDSLDLAAGARAARLAGLAVLASLRSHCGSLDSIAWILRTVGLVNATPEFTDHPAVINGFSELMRDVFGEQAGIGARSAFGVASLPGGWAVEIEAEFELK
jgi:enamine deaminase RidA (YjgF/YER057c/UK114 family)